MVMAPAITAMGRGRSKGKWNETTDDTDIYGFARIDQKYKNDIRVICSYLCYPWLKKKSITQRRKVRKDM